MVMADRKQAMAAAPARQTQLEDVAPALLDMVLPSLSNQQRPRQLSQTGHVDTLVTPVTMSSKQQRRLHSWSLNDFWSYARSRWQYVAGNYPETLLQHEGTLVAAEGTIYIVQGTTAGKVASLKDLLELIQRQHDGIDREDLLIQWRLQHGHISDDLFEQMVSRLEGKKLITNHKGRLRIKKGDG